MILIYVIRLQKNTLYSDTITYSFKITDDNDNPLEGAIVSLQR
jgi:hypothetical protein